MASTPQEQVILGENANKKVRPPPGEEVVISGMSGIFPKSDSTLEFMENLYNKVDMVTSEDPRWVFNHPEMPKHLGKVNGMTKFDAQFFRVHYKQACTMEPMSRKLLEHTYSAIYDSGINPLQLRGIKIGVFIGSTFSESEKIVIYENIQKNGFGVTGCNKSMYANRISYWIDGKGPSYALDLACASSMACVEHAYRSISSGQCDAAIVGGCNLCMHPNVSLNFRRAGFLTLDGKTRCFDKNSDGHVRSDAISVLFMQKAKDARRIYSEVYHAKLSFSSGDSQYLSIRQPKELQQFLEAFYSELDVSPEDVEYIEANGAANVEADTNELEAIGSVFAQNKPVQIGCVKSNMGSSEPASGLCAITKVCFAYHTGKIPGNLHYCDPLDIPHIKDGKIQVLTDNVQFNRGYAALNSLSYSGANVHVLLKARYKPKDLTHYKSSIPYIILMSGRQEDGVENMLHKLKKDPIDPEQIGLIHNIHRYDIPGHMSRGYIILDTNEQNQTLCLSQNVQYFPGNTRPIWFVYSGMGSQWAGMGTELMRIPIFAAAIQKCHKVLEPKGIDIVRILTDPDKTIFDNILHSFVGIAAVQIGLTDVLRELGIVPDNIIGHSVGELGCAYADGCFTAEEMILSAYSRGLISVQTPFIKGSMAAIGLGYKTILPMLPPEIEIACHNSAESSTISGPVDVMKKFVAELTSQGIFAKEVPCSNIAFHSRYIADGGPKLLKHLQEVIKKPKPRSEKWVSTSVPEEKWNEPIAKYSSAEYHTNNLLHPVLFEETSELIPGDAIVIEIAPHGLLQAILKKSLGESVHIPLTRRGATDPIKFLLEAIGKLYQVGLNPKVDVLYPKIEYPVSTGTPFLSHYVEWEHSENWPEVKYCNKNRKLAMIRDITMSIHDDDYKYFKGHNRQGSVILPEAALVHLTWETYAMYTGVNYNDLSVTFQNVQFHNEAIINTDHLIKLSIMINKGNNRFEVTYEGTRIVTGYIFDIKTNENDHNICQTHQKDDISLNRNDIYTMLRLRGYNYKDEFQSIYSSNFQRTKGSLVWNKNWVTFIDSIFQFNAFSRNHEGISLLSMIRTLTIDVEQHKTHAKVTTGGVTCMDADLYNIYDYTKSGGVEVKGLVFKDIPQISLEQQPDVLLKRKFVPHFFPELTEINTALQTNLQIVADNIEGRKVDVVTTLSSLTNSAYLHLIEEVANTLPSVEFVFKTEIDNDTKLIIMDNLLDDEKKMDTAKKTFPKTTFILAIEKNVTNINPNYEMFAIISKMNVREEVMVLLKMLDDENANITYMPIFQDRKFSWINKFQDNLAKTKKLVLVSERQPICGLLGMVKKLREVYGNKIGLVLIEDYTVTPFNPEHSIYKEQLCKGLSINVLVKGNWGGYYYISEPKMSVNVQNIQLSMTKPCELDSLDWVEKAPIVDTNLKIQVVYAGPSYRDAQNACSKINDNHNFGMDFSGINNRGERVMGLLPEGALSSTVEADLDLLWPVPYDWSLEDAATVPLPYVLAYYCLAIRTQFITSPNNIFQENKTVFVNGGAGALGQAVISICLSLNCTVYTTVSDVKKKELLLRLFPQLDANKIGQSADCFFYDMIRNSTHYFHRCDLVINCASGPMRKSGMNCVGFNKEFLDLSEYDMSCNEEFGMGYHHQLANHYKAVQLKTLFKSDYAGDKKIIQTLISDGIANGIVKPLTRIVYTPANVSRAFRLLSLSKHRGRVLIKMSNSETAAKYLNVISRMTYSSEGTYIVICDETAIGMELADRLVKHGAKKLVIHLKPNSIGGYCYTKFLSWNKSNVAVNTCSENLQTEKGCVNLIQAGAKLGPILGIFIVQDLNTDDSFHSEKFSVTFNKTSCVVSNLDKASRNVCNKLEHFVVFNHSIGGATDEYMASVTDRICQARNDIGLPALVQRIGLLKEIDEITSNDGKIQPQSIYTALNALETSLKLKYNNIIAYNLKKDKSLVFLDKIAAVLGLKNINEIDETLSLKNFFVNENVIDEVNEVIREACRISYPADKLQDMTVADLKNLGEYLTKSRSEVKSGLEAFYKHIEKNECLAAEPMVNMTTNFSNIIEEEEMDPKATYLFLLPGFESRHDIFNTVCEYLKVPAIVFQYGPELTNANVLEMAAYIKKCMRKRFELKSKFYLLGYSFGVNVTLELASLIEEEGHVGVVYCLDSSPDVLGIQFNAYVGSLSDTHLQNKVIQHMYKLMLGQDSEDLIQDLENIDSWNDKIELCVNKLRGKVNYSHQYVKCIIQGAYNRIILAREYRPKFKLQSQLVLIKGVPHPKAEKLPEDYGLSKYSHKPVQVFDIASEHITATQDCKVADIVNSLLEPKLLEEFKNKNLCWSYLEDPVKSW